jgi:hypothetical protein
VFSNWLALSLNFLTDVAQVLVSILGNMFKTSWFPAKSDKETTDKSLLR